MRTTLSLPVVSSRSSLSKATDNTASVRRGVSHHDAPLFASVLKHTPVGTPMRIAIARGDGLVRVEVHDQGSGVPPDARVRIFEKFETADRDGHHRSSGLGLAFCKLAIEAHGGAIGVNPGVPVGSTFWFELPTPVPDIDGDRVRPAG